ncbi:unnamed protein product [Mytilus edulis]|uniref:Uncharacterized protein n=1 Tax=Mytilus edulis TaxID=6550 RepID=A0A8S3V1V8_MYTED|nr:unnamed protein product [Mytilus edulis]
MSIVLPTTYSFGADIAREMSDVTKHQSIQDETELQSLQGGTNQQSIQSSTKHQSIEDGTQNHIIQDGTKHQSIQDGTKHQSIQEDTTHQSIPDDTKHKRKRENFEFVSGVMRKKLSHKLEECVQTKRTKPKRKTSDDSSSSSVTQEETVYEEPDIFKRIKQPVLPQHGGELLVHAHGHHKWNFMKNIQKF